MRKTTMKSCRGVRRHALLGRVSDSGDRAIQSMRSGVISSDPPLMLITTVWTSSENICSGSVVRTPPPRALRPQKNGEVRVTTHGRHMRHPKTQNSPTTHVSVRMEVDAYFFPSICGTHVKSSNY